MIVDSLTQGRFPFMEIVHVELNEEGVTCLWKEVKLECLK